jgi:hypothetical protein
MKEKLGLEVWLKHLPIKCKALHTTPSTAEKRNSSQLKKQIRMTE